MSIDIGNTADYMIVPDYLRENYLKLIDEYDKEWQPWFLNMFPKQVGPGRGSQRRFIRPRMADPQGIAKIYGEDEAIEPMNYPHVRPWSYMTRKLGNAFRRNKRTFKEDFKDGIIDRAHAQLVENLTKFINRGLEFMLTRFAYGDQIVMPQFTDQNLNRQAVVNLRAGLFNGAADARLGAQSWDNFGPGTPPVFEDLAHLKERFKFMAGMNPKYMMIGRMTEYVLEINDDLLDRLIRIQDTTQGVLGEYLMGLNLVKVVGQTYKDIPGADVTLEGMPGKGDYLEQDWNRLNKQDMMVENFAGGIYEWSIIGVDGVGEVSCGWVDEDHKSERGSPTDIFVEQWEARNPKQVWTTAQLEVCPVVYDYSKMMLVRGVAAQ
jgi:hypothetical protein